MHHARLPQVPRSTSHYVLCDVSLWSQEYDALLHDAEIEVSDGRIAYAGPARPGDATDAPRFSLAGHTVLPGFIDTHVHLLASIEMSMQQQVSQFPSEMHFAAARNAQLTLEAGVTTARDLGGLDAGFRNAIAAGHIRGPRLHIAQAVISPTGGHADFRLPNGVCIDVPGAADMARIVDTDDEMRVAVRDLVRGGSDVIKVCTTGGVSSPTDTPDDLGVPESQVAIAVAETARRQGQPIAAHAQGSAGIIEAIRGGVSSIEHGYEIDAEGIALMRERGTVLVPTLSSALRVPDPAKVPPYLYEKKVRWSALAREHVARAIEAGVTIALGTDAGICPHAENLLELRHLVDLGMDPVEALRAGTINAARLLRLDDHLGSLTAGKVADLVVVAGDPLEDIGHLAAPENILSVVQGGTVIKNLGVNMPN